jgi:ribose 5-phosphate isomerase B
MKKLFIASDHAGIELKKRLTALLNLFIVTEKGEDSIEWVDLGPNSETSVDYPDYALKVGDAIQKNPGSFGILICGSGIGMSISANKLKGIRAALCPVPEYARLARQHNHANILCLGARFLTEEAAIEITQAFLSTAPSMESRHVNRVRKSDELL